MKKIELRNRENSAAVQRNGYDMCHMTSPEVLSKIGAMEVNIEPGKTAFSYHYHEGSEEIFYIARGRGSIRTSDGNIDVKEGDYISFPTGENGAHVITNTSDEILTYINFHNCCDVDVGYFPDRKQVMIMDRKGMNFYDLKE